MKSKKIITIAALVATSFGLVSCGNEPSQGLVDASSYLYQMYKDVTSTPVTYQLNNKLVFAEETFYVSWAFEKGENFIEGAAKIGEVTESKTTIDIVFGTEKTDKDSEYKLTASITDAKGKHVLTREFDRYVPKCNPSTVEAFVAAEKTDDFKKETFVFTGIITSVNKVGKEGSFTITDSTGSLFSYSGAEVTLGDEVLVSGSYSENYSFPQLDKVSVIAVKQSNQLANAFKAENVTTLDISKLPEIAAGYADSSTKLSTITSYCKGLYKFTGGTLNKNSKGYLSLTAEGIDGNISVYANDDISKAASSLVDEEVDLYGVIRGINKSGSILTVQTTKIVAKGATVTF